MVTQEALEKRDKDSPPGSDNLVGIYNSLLRFVSSGECLPLLAITKNTFKATSYDLLSNGKFNFFLIHSLSTNITTFLPLINSHLA